MFQKAHAVIDTVITPDAKFLPDFHVLPGSVCRILIKRGRIGNPDVGLIQMTHICRVYAGRYPTLAEVEIQLVKLDAAGPGFIQRFEGILRHADEWLDAVITGKAFYPFFLTVNPRLDSLGFGNDVSGDESVFYLVVFHKGIIIYVSFEILGEGVLVHIHQR